MNKLEHSKLESIYSKIGDLVVMEQLVNDNSFVYEIVDGRIFLIEVMDDEWQIHQFRIIFKNDKYDIHFFRIKIREKMGIYQFQTEEDVLSAIRKFFLLRGE